jgi:HD-GYP domain-containing protein (c-di-GMP phosphodiesterase class II)
MAADPMQNRNTAEVERTWVSPSVQASLSAHSRAAGLCLLLMQPDGTVLHDAAAGSFFDRYVIPALRRADLAGNELLARVGQLTAQSPPQVWNLVPGVTVCAVPYVERRQVHGVVALAAKTPDFQLGEDVVRLCSQLGLDATWLGQQADALSPHAIDRLSNEVALFLTLLTDRLRQSSLEQEINSLSTQLANAYEELTLIDQISSGMRVNRRSNDFFRQACLDVMQVMCVRGMGVALHTDKVCQDPALYGELVLPPDQVQRLADQLLATLEQRKSCFLINDLKQDKAYAWLAQSASRLIAIPLLRSDQVLGCLFGLDKLGGDFDSVDSKLLTAIANESAIYLENAMLYGDVHNLMMGLLRSLTSAVDAKDAYTCGHSERVAILAQYMGAKAGLPDAQVERVYMAGLLHDVGKIGVPESVLQKTGRLTVEEFELMKRHCQIGARILADVKQLEDIVPGVLHHHERYDGRGYPMGLAGRDIPILGRIICLADCFDAMTSNRTYRKALPLEVALTEIHRCSGTQFDPALAEFLLQIPVEQLHQLLRDSQQPARQLLLQQNLRAA